jgi:hypothetical protein
MANLPALIARFPARELEIRRLHARDEDFRCACDDYEAAVKALEHWEGAGHNSARAAEYHQFVSELADEIAALLDAASVSTTTR